MYSNGRGSNPLGRWEEERRREEKKVCGREGKEVGAESSLS